METTKWIQRTLKFCPNNQRKKKKQNLCKKHWAFWTFFIRIYASRKKMWFTSRRRKSKSYVLITTSSKCWDKTMLRSPIQNLYLMFSRWPILCKKKNCIKTIFDERNEEKNWLPRACLKREWWGKGSTCQTAIWGRDVWGKRKQYRENNTKVLLFFLSLFPSSTKNSQIWGET